MRTPFMSCYWVEKASNFINLTPHSAPAHCPPRSFHHLLESWWWTEGFSVHIKSQYNLLSRAFPAKRLNGVFLHVSDRLPWLVSVQIQCAEGAEKVCWPGSRLLETSDRSAGGNLLLVDPPLLQLLCFGFFLTGWRIRTEETSDYMRPTSVFLIWFICFCEKKPN